MTKTGETTQVRASATPEAGSVRRDAIARQTSAWLFTLSEDENRVIANVVDRVRKAVPQYGHLDIRTDKRDWQGEAGAEILDFLFYVGAEWLKQRLARVDAIDSASARADVSHGNPQAGGGTFSCDAQSGRGCYIVHGPHRKCSCGCHSAPSHPSNGSQRVGGGCTCDDNPRTCTRHPYVYEGPNGTPRGRRDYSPNSRLTATLADRIDPRLRSSLRELAAAKPQVAAPGVAMEWDMTDLDGDE